MELYINEHIIIQLSFENNGINNIFIDRNTGEIIKKFTTLHSPLFFSTQKA